MLPANCEYVVNFAPQLAEIISETKYLEKLGFKVCTFNPCAWCGHFYCLTQVSDLARSVALQEDKFIAFKDGLEHCLARYHKVLTTLSYAEVSSSQLVLNLSLH